MKSLSFCKVSRCLPLLLVTLWAGVFPATAQSVSHVMGDVNLDGEVTVADVNSVINVILDDSGLTSAADVNSDGEINIADVNVIIDLILGGGNNYLEVCKKASAVDRRIEDYYEQCASIDQLMEYADAIKAIDGVEDVYTDGHTTMFVKIKDFRVISYSYYPEPSEADVMRMKESFNEFQSMFSRQNQAQTSFNHSINNAKFLAVNQQTDIDYSIQSAGIAASLFRGLGFEAKVHDSPDVEFFRDSIFDCDYLFLITHGNYDFKTDNHWVATSVPVPRDKNNAIDPNFLLRYQDYPPEDLTFGNNSVLVSEHFINKSSRRFRHPGQAIVFNVSCKSMTGPGSVTNDSMTGPGSVTNDSIDTGLADVFINNGACAYVGYDETNWGGQVSGLEFWHRLSSGNQISNAFNSLSPWLYSEYHKEKKRSFYCDLKMYSFEEELSTYVVQPSISVEDHSDDNRLQIELRASNVYTSFIQATNFYSWKIINDPSELSLISIKYGFELSENEQFVNAVTIDEKQLGDDGLGLTYLDYTHTLSCEAGQTDAQIQPNNTYWVRAYVYDGNGYNYSEPISFSTRNLEPTVEQIPVGNTGLTIEMVLVEGGTFMMGNNDDIDEMPVHKVTLSSFAIGQTEVTQELWQAVMGSNPSWYKGDLNCPVEYVSWHDCWAFIRKLNEMTGKCFRLPTEAEWEFAARGGNLGHGYEYSGSDNLNVVASLGSMPAAVGSKAPNELGLYDMSGNVCEWVQDWFGKYKSNDQINPRGPSFGNCIVYRGGGFNSGGCGVSRRESDYPMNKKIDLGLRLAMSSEPEPDSQCGYVDLGLPSGTLWATMNIGATSPEEYGDYFAWGEIISKDVYNWGSYEWCNGSYDTITKYGTDSNGVGDNKTELDPEDDAAYMNWGPSWRMPTSDEQSELCKICTWKWTTLNGKRGYLAIGPNGKSLFFPAAGRRAGSSLSNAGLWGYYWSRTIVANTYYPNCAYSLSFNSGDVGDNEDQRAYGYSVRAVRVSQN